MELKDFDFNKCRYSPLSKTFVTNISKAIPAFNEYREQNRKSAFQYVVALYDKESPLWEKEPEYFPRKVLAAKLTGVSRETNSGSLTKEAMEILEGKDDKINILVVAYLANIGDMDYSMLINELTMYYGYTMRMMTPNKMLDKAEYETLQKLAVNIQERTRKMFGSGKDDEIARVKNLLYEKSEQNRQRLYPEAIVKVFDEGGDFPAEWGPYGTKYNVEPLTYKQDDSQGAS